MKEDYNDLQPDWSFLTESFDLSRFEKDTDGTHASRQSTRDGFIDRKMCDESCSERPHQSGDPRGIVSECDQFCKKERVGGG